jgi:hypothetical protein
MNSAAEEKFAKLVQGLGYFDEDDIDPAIVSALLSKYKKKIAKQSLKSNDLIEQANLKALKENEKVAAKLNKEIEQVEKAVKEQKGVLKSALTSKEARKAKKDEIKHYEYAKNAERHKKYIEPKAPRQDLSEAVKDIIKKTEDQGAFKMAVFQGFAGGKRKILQCPHCEKSMIASGVKLKRNIDPDRPKTGSQQDWFQFVNAVGSLPEFKGKKRSIVMKAASKLKAGGYKIDELASINLPEQGIV